MGGLHIQDKYQRVCELDEIVFFCDAISFFVGS